MLGSPGLPSSVHLVVLQTPSSRQVKGGKGKRRVLEYYSGRLMSTQHQYLQFQRNPNLSSEGCWLRILTVTVPCISSRAQSDGRRLFQIWLTKTVTVLTCVCNLLGLQPRPTVYRSSGRRHSSSGLCRSKGFQHLGRILDVEEARGEGRRHREDCTPTYGEKNG